jgi:cell division protein FtsB
MNIIIISIVILLCLACIQVHVERRKYIEHEYIVRDALEKSCKRQREELKAVKNKLNAYKSLVSRMKNDQSTDDSTALPNINDMSRADLIKEVLSHGKDPRYEAVVLDRIPEECTVIQCGPEMLRDMVAELRNKGGES